MRVAVIAFSAAAVVATASSVAAQVAASVCTRLEARLALLDRGPDPMASANYERYQQALQQQRGEYERLRQQAQRQGCGGGFLFFRSQQPSAQCGPITDLLNRMERNLSELEARRNQYSYQPRDNGWERQEVMAALAQNRCGPAYERYSGGFSGFFFGRQRSDPWSRSFGGDGFGGGTYRTLCVRTCDGYYFPMSFSTVQSKFAEDDQACKSACPGSEVSLYVHRNPGEESEQMVSLSGQPYSALPTAFAYRQAYNAACTCRSATSLASVTTTTRNPGPMPQTTSARAERVVPSPVAKPPRGEDPETLANLAGKFTPRPARPGEEEAVVGLVESGGKKVRIVGPSYYYAQ